MPEKTFVFLTALQLEAAALRRAMDTAGLSVLPIYTIGMKASRLHQLPSLGDSRQVVIAGLGGGLDPVLGIGEVIFDGPPQMLLPANVRRGGIVTSPQVVQTTEQKASFFKTTGAVAVDMEQSIVAAWAAERGHTVIGLRAISDTATDTLDPILTHLVDELGRPRPAPIAKALFRRPMLAVELLRLGRRSQIALGNLAKAAVAIASLND